MNETGRVRYHAPELRRVSPVSGLRDVTTEITLEGRFLGRSDEVLTSVLVGDAECTNVQRVTEHLVTCMVQPGMSGTHNVTIHVGKESTMLSSSFTIEEASIIYASVVPAYYPFWTDTKVAITINTIGLSEENTVR